MGSGSIDNFSEYQLLLYGAGTAEASYGLGIRPSTLVYHSGSMHDFDA